MAIGDPGARQKLVNAFGFVLPLICLAALASPAQASNGTWNRAWGKNVNGGGVFGICTTAASCVAGTTGGLGGELNQAGGVATDSAGNVYVADNGNQRIQKFDSSGKWLRAWGKGVNGGSAFGICTVAASCHAGSTGSLGGEFNDPFGIATDGANNVYVVDAFNNRVQKFDSSGNFQRAWGKGVNGGTSFGICTVAASCQAGTSGGLGGEFNIPVGVAADAANNVYIGEQNNNRVQKFDSSGNFQRAWGKGVNGGTGFGICAVAASCQAGTSGGLGGELNHAEDVATDSASNVYVNDYSNQRVQKFDSSGNFQRAWGKGVNGGTSFGICTVAASCQAGTSGALGGEFNGPSGVTTDSLGNVYVAEVSNHRIQKFDSSGNFQRAWGKGVNGGTSFGICTVAASCQAGSTGSLGGELSTPQFLAADAAGNIYVADFGNARIQKFADPHTLSVSLAGPGTVTGTGISCPGSCVQSYPDGTLVTLSATPAAGSSFAGWSGACSGTGPCNLTMSSNESVTATFALGGGAPQVPHTTITQAKISKKKHRATFTFTATNSPTGFHCALQIPKKGKKKPKLVFSSCSSSKTYKKLRPGKYTFLVEAFNAAGTGPAQSKTFKIKR